MDESGQIETRQLAPQRPRPEAAGRRQGKVLVCNSIVCAGAGSSNLLGRAQQLAAGADTFTVGETACLKECHGIATLPWPWHTPAVHVRGPKGDRQLCPRACFDRDIEDLARACRATGIDVPEQAAASVEPGHLRGHLRNWARDLRLVGRHFRGLAQPYVGILLGCLGLQVAVRFAEPSDPYFEALQKAAAWSAFYGPYAIFVSAGVQVSRRALSPYEPIEAYRLARQRQAAAAAAAAP